MKCLGESLTSVPKEGNVYFTKVDIRFLKNDDVENKQQTVDFAFHLNTMDKCLERAKCMLKVFEEKCQDKKQEYPQLRSLRKKYHLAHLSDDQYLGSMRVPKASKASQGPYVIVLNHKGSSPPNLKEVKDHLWHPLALEYELMRRVIVEVKDGVESSNSIRLHFQPKLRRNCLQYLILDLEVISGRDKSTNVLGNQKERYIFDLEKDLPIKSESELDLQIRQKLRSLLLFDMLYKIKQEALDSPELKIEELSEFLMTTELEVEKLFTLKAKFEFCSDIDPFVT